MAWGAFTHRGSNNEKANDNSISVSPTANLAVDAIIIVRCVTDGTVTHTLADSKSNNWTKLYNQSDPTADATVSMFVSKLTTSILTTDSITLTLSANQTAKVIGIEETSVAAGKTFSSLGSSAAAGTGLSPSVTLSGLANSEHLWLGQIAVEGPNTDGFTQDADYTAGTEIGTTGGGATTNVSSRFGKRVFTGTSDTYNPNLGTSRDWIAVLVALDEVDVPTGPSPGLRTLGLTGVGL